MPVYNAGDYLVEAIESIINQTYTDWELIAVDDNSKDNSYSILRTYAANDRRIKVFKNVSNKGVSATASFALVKAKGDFIARMDADDVAFPDRFEKQVEFLVNNPKTIIVGAQCQLINADGEFTGMKTFPLNFKQIKKMIFVTIPMQQPSVMINTNLLPKNFQWYDKKFNVAEEIELMFKLFTYGDAYNLPEVLLKYRIHGKNISLSHPKETFYMTLRARIKGIVKYGYKPTLKSVAISFIQTLAVTMLPEKWIYPIYVFARGLKQKTTPFTDKLSIAPVQA